MCFYIGNRSYEVIGIGSRVVLQALTNVVPTEENSQRLYMSLCMCLSLCLEILRSSSTAGGDNGTDIANELAHRRGRVRIRQFGHHGLQCLPAKLTKAEESERGRGREEKRREEYFCPAATVNPSGPMLLIAVVAAPYPPRPKSFTARGTPTSRLS